MAALWLSLQLAGVSTILLLLIGTPLAWWLARTDSRFKPIVEAITALPLVLPPTVLGFYLLIVFSPTAPVGQFWEWFTGGRLAFSFSGLVIASMLYSLPFTVQPLQTSFQGLGRRPAEMAAMMGAGPLDAFFTIIVPMASKGFVTAAVLSFAHTIGEFGVVLMIGGSIPGETRVISIALYEQVESLRFGEAHRTAGILMLLSFVTLVSVYTFNRQARLRVH